MFRFKCLDVQILSVKVFILMNKKQQLILITNTCLIYGASTQLISSPIILNKFKFKVLVIQPPSSQHIRSHTEE